MARCMGVIQVKRLMIPSCKIITILRKVYVNLIYRSSKLDFSLSLKEWFYRTCTRNSALKQDPLNPVLPINVSHMSYFAKAIGL
jgi:hypothetical protein